MSTHHEQEPWIDRWWPLLLILFGLTFTLCLALFRPGDKRPEAATLTRHPAGAVATARASSTTFSSPLTRACKPAGS